MKSLKKNIGQAYPEYIIAGLILMVALLVPMPEAIAPDNANGNGCDTKECAYQFGFDINVG